MIKYNVNSYLNGANMKIDTKVAIFAAAAIALSGAAFPAAKSASAAEDPFALLSTLQEECGFSDARAEFTLDKVLSVGYGSVYRFQQIKDGVPVFGRGINLSVGKKGELLSYNSSYRQVSPAKAEESVEEAASLAESLGFGQALSAQETVYAFGTEEEPAYEIATPTAQLVLSARDGEVLLSAPRVSPYSVPSTQIGLDGEEKELDIEYDELRRTYYLSDPVRNIYTYDSMNNESYGLRYSSQTGQFDDPTAVSVFANAVKAYDFYTDENNIGTELFGFNGKNDDVADNAEQNGEIPLRIYVHYGSGYENANCGYDSYSRSAIMFVGDGKPDGVLYEQGKSADVIAHEYQHAVTQFAADLVYLNESGSLNEGISDMFGALVEGHDPSEEEFWQIGEEVSPPPNDCLRSMKSRTGDQRYTVAEMVPPCNRPGNHDYHNCDYGGAHDNSTVITHMQYLAYEKMPDFFTREKIGNLWYATLCSLSSRATFDEFALQLLRSAQALGYGDEALGALRDSLYESGILQRGTEDDIHFVRFTAEDGTVLGEEVVRHGERADTPEDPEKAATPQYEYRFIGWSGDVSSVTEDLDLTPRYEDALRVYSVTYLDADGNVLKRENVFYGSFLLPPDPPAIPGTDECDYVFDGWEGLPDAVTGDVVATARYRETPKYYTVSFVLNGEKYDEISVPYGESFVPPEPGEKFGGWYLDEGLTAPLSDRTVTEDMTLYAAYRPQEGCASSVFSGIFAVSLGAAIALCIILRKERG